MKLPNRWPGLLLVGVVAYLVVLIATVPAPLAWRLAASQLKLPSQLVVGNIRGTLWSGSAAPLQLHGLALHELRWDLRPLGLLSGGLLYDLELALPEGHADGRLRIQPGGVQLLGWRGALPAAQLAGPLPQLPVLLQGRLVLDLPRLELGSAGKVTALEGTLGWLDAAAGLTTPLPLGDLRGELGREKDGTLVATLTDQGGALGLQGAVKLSPNGSYRLDATVIPRDGAAPELRSALATMAKPDARGGHRIALRGRL